MHCAKNGEKADSHHFLLCPQCFPKFFFFSSSFFVKGVTRRESRTNRKKLKTTLYHCNLIVNDKLKFSNN